MNMCQLMDYSLVVGTVLRPTRGSSLKGTPKLPDNNLPPGCGNQPYVLKDGGWGYDVAYYMGVIDFLQEWTLQKKIPMCIKMPVAPQPQSTIPPTPYAHQFLNHMTQKFQPTDVAMVDCPSCGHEFPLDQNMASVQFNRGA